MRLYTKLIVIFLSVGFLPLILIGGFSIRNIKSNIQVTSDHTWQVLAAEVAKEVWRPLEEGYRNMLLLAQNPVLGSPESTVEQLSAELRDTRNYNRIFKDITLLNPRGQVRTSVFHSFSGSRKSESWLQAAFSGEVRVAEAGPDMRGTMRTVDSGSGPAAPGIDLHVAVPVFDMKGKARDVIVGQYDMRKIEEIVAAVSIGNEGKVFLLNGEGVVVAASGADRSFPPIDGNPLSYRSPGSSSGVFTFKDGEHTKVASYASLPSLGAGGEDVPGWSVMIVQPYKNVYAPVYRARYLLFITAGICVFIVNIVSFLLGSRIHGRVEKLVNATRLIGRGDFTQKLENLGKDEIGEIGNSINWSAGQLSEAHRKNQEAESALRKSYEELEKRVQERTMELAHEVEERKRAEAYSLRAKEEAEAANTAKSEFLANMSHELRTPLNHIIGFTELIVDKKFGELTETQEEFLGDVLGSSRHLLALINDILDLSKVEAGKLDYTPVQVDLKGLLENSLKMVTEKALKHRLRLRMDFGDAPKVITADDRKLRQIIYNLLSNAVKFTPEGGKISLKANGETNGDGTCAQDGRRYVRISVSDSGIGLKNENLEKIFDPFVQVKNEANRQSKGTGLGLSLTKRLVELHGGRIWAESEGEGRGSTFHVLIPV